MGGERGELSIQSMLSIGFEKNERGGNFGAEGAERRREEGGEGRLGKGNTDEHGLARTDTDFGVALTRLLVFEKFEMKLELFGGELDMENLIAPLFINSGVIWGATGAFLLRREGGVFRGRDGLWGEGYLPTQKREKMVSRRSSEQFLPKMWPICSRAEREWVAAGR